jgi:hypothetical protein
VVNALNMREASAELPPVEHTAKKKIVPPRPAVQRTCTRFSNTPIPFGVQL